MLKRAILILLLALVAAPFAFASKIAQEPASSEAAIHLPIPARQSRDLPPCTTREGQGRDLDLLARVIYAEARGESFAGKVAVGAVVLNRVRDPRFPNSVPAVVHAPGQFAVSRGGVRLPAECYAAAWAALDGEDPTGGALFFYNPETATCPWIRTREMTVEIGGHRFAR